VLPTNRYIGMSLICLSFDCHAVLQLFQCSA